MAGIGVRRAHHVMMSMAIKRKKRKKHNSFSGLTVGILKLNLSMKLWRYTSVLLLKCKGHASNNHYNWAHSSRYQVQNVVTSCKFEHTWVIITESSMRSSKTLAQFCFRSNYSSNRWSAIDRSFEIIKMSVYHHGQTEAGVDISQRVPQNHEKIRRSYWPAG